MAERNQTQAVVAEGNCLTEHRRRATLALGIFEDQPKSDEKIAFEEAKSVFADQPI